MKHARNIRIKVKKKKRMTERYTLQQSDPILLQFLVLLNPQVNDGKEHLSQSGSFQASQSCLILFKKCI